VKTLDRATVEALVAAARRARRAAYAPYSRFRVGAAVLDDQGRVHTGCNVECGSYGLSNCAERVAIQKAVSEGARRVVAVAVAGPDGREPTPCGACRQVMEEFGTHFVVLVQRGRPRVYAFQDLLPWAFHSPRGKP
jgi:cytidine deaminase